MVDFNCKEVFWEDWTTEGSEMSWGNKWLPLAMNILTQSMEKDTSYRGDEEPSQLDLVFTKKTEILKNLVHKSPIGKSDYVLIELKLMGRPEGARRGL